MRRVIKKVKKTLKKKKVQLRLVAVRNVAKMEASGWQKAKKQGASDLVLMKK